MTNFGVCEIIKHMWQLIFEIFCILSGAFVIVMFFMHEGPQEMAERKTKERQARKPIQKD